MSPEPHLDLAPQPKSKKQAKPRRQQPRKPHLQVMPLTQTPLTTSSNTRLTPQNAENSPTAAAAVVVS